VVLEEGEKPNPRGHFTSGYANYRWCRDEDYVMFCRNDGSEAKLYDVRTDPHQTRDLAEEEPETVETMFEEYVLRDADDSLVTH
jgi:arylsulfatase A-like enzyme